MGFTEVRKKTEEESRKRFDDKFREQSKKRLLKAVETKMRTTFIGAISAIEEELGALWGHGKNKLTEEEEEFKRIWERLRSHILDTGNSQLRAIVKEINQYNIAWEEQYVSLYLSKKMEELNGSK